MFDNLTKTGGSVKVRNVFKCPTEHQESQKFYEWSQYHPIARDYLHKLSNERNSAKQGSKFKSEGQRAGVSDYFLSYPTNDKHGLWIEMKRSVKSLSNLSEKQASFLAMQERVGYATKVAYGADEAIKTVEEYLK